MGQNTFYLKAPRGTKAERNENSADSGRGLTADIWQRSWREAERKKWGHLEGQNNLEPITQSTRWDPSTPPYSPTYSSHDVILQQVATLSYITAHRPGETARDKPDECFSALKILDRRIIRSLYTNRLVSKNRSSWILRTSQPVS